VTRRESHIGVGGIIVMLTALSIGIAAVSPCVNMFGYRGDESFTMGEGRTRQGDAERPFSQQVPTVEVTSRLSTLLIPVRSFHQSENLAEALTATPDVTYNFGSSTSRANSTRWFVLRI